MQKNSPNIIIFFFFFCILGCHYGFTNYFEILKFAFSNIVAGYQEAGFSLLKVNGRGSVPPPPPPPPPAAKNLLILPPSRSPLPCQIFIHPALNNNFQNYNPIKTAFLVVVIAPVSFLF